MCHFKNLVSLFLPPLLSLFLPWPSHAQPGNLAPLGGPYGGGVTALAVSPSNPAIVYAGTDRGGVFKSLDGGESWARASRGLPEISEVIIVALAVDSSNPDVALLAVAPLSLTDPLAEVAVFKTLDGGENWSPSEEGLLAERVVSSLAFDPSDPRMVYTILAGEVWKSSDAGDTWQRASGQPPRAFESPLAISSVSGGPTFIYLVARSQTSPGRNALWRSGDGGANWQRVSPGVDARAHSLLIHPEDPEKIYVGFDGGLLLRTVDLGASWQEIAIDRFDRPITALAADLEDPDHLWAAYLALGLYESRDGGDTWSRVSERIFPPRNVWTLAPDAPSARLRAGSIDAGIYRLENDSWLPANRGLLNSFVTEVELDRSTSPPTLYAGTPGGLWRTRDRGVTWMEINGDLEHRVVTALAVGEGDGPEPAVLYAAIDEVFTSNATIMRSFDGGATWLEPGDGFRVGRVTSLAVEPGRPQRAWATIANSSRVFRTLDAGATWERITIISTGGQPSFGDMTDVVVLPAGPESPPTVLVATDRTAWRSLDNGASWTRRLSPGRWLAAGVESPEVVYSAGFDRGLVRTEDGGEIWRVVSDELPPHRVDDVIRDPFDPSIVYITGPMEAGEDRAVWRSLDGGVSWSILSQDRPGEIAAALALDPTAGPPLLYAGTLGHGVFAAPSDSRQTSVDLLAGEYRVELEWRDANGASDDGRVVRIGGGGRNVPLVSEDSAVLAFFDRDNWEMLAKVLDGSSVNGNSWVFLAAATDVGYEVTVTDTSCGTVQRYRHPAGRAAPAVIDTSAFPDCANPEPPSCSAGEETICLGDDGRFRLEAEWRTTAGASGAATQVELERSGLAASEDSTLFYFFSPDNWEILVKVLDGCEVNGNVWVFAAATTDVGYTLKVTEIETGEVETWTNPVGTAADAIIDTSAFRCRP